MGRQANPKGLDLGPALDYPGRASSRSGGKFASLAAATARAIGSVLNVVMATEEALPP